MENSKKKSLKWLWIVLAVVVVAALGVWCALNAVNNPKIKPIKDENGVTIEIRTAEKLIHNDGINPVVATDFPKGTVISVKGVIDSYNDKYQIKVFDINDITFEK